MSFTTLDEAWGEPQNYPAANVPQKVFQGGNVPQKVFQGGNVPQKVMQANNGGTGYTVGTQGMPNDAMEVARLQAMVHRLMQENHTVRAMANTNKPRGLSVAEICMVVVALVFLVLVVYLISLIRSLKA